MISLRFHITSPFTGYLGFTGVPLRAAFLNIMREYSNDLSAMNHDGGMIRAYSLDPIPFERDYRTFFEEGEDYSFGVNLFDASILEEMLRSVALNPKPYIRLHHYYFPLKRVDFIDKSASQLVVDWTAEELETMDSIVISFRFITPTQLSQFGSDKAYLLPTPEKVFSGLARVWNTIDKVTKLERIGQYYDWLVENVIITSHRIRTISLPLSRNRNIVGFVGVVHYRLLDIQNPFARLTTNLARFAEIANVGKNRSAGFGKVHSRVKVEYRTNNREWRELEGVHASRRD